ncbi:MAG TPA: triphosphoribosyl-dephospho-CoA synthase [Planctomycetaceae bacterium]|nr:triphosphoribosyl-dephospho-CoA synthase [Planctomycetaceae bacterium]
MTDATSDLANLIRLACVWEATAAKPGNVHPQAAFADLTYSDLVCSADAVAPILARTAELGVGHAIFTAIQATRAVVRSNTNLGIVLLLAPLAAVPTTRTLRDGLDDVLTRLTREDAVWVYRAIRLAQPGGLGSADAEDVSNEPTGTLLDVMTLAADRDGVAAQYANRFSWVLDEGAPFLKTVTDFDNQWEPAIIELQLRLLTAHPDTLIARKCGRDVAAETARRAREILEAGGPRTSAGRSLVGDFDRWLREDGHRRNPGTTADLITACLFAALRDESRLWASFQSALPDT